MPIQSAIPMTCSEIQRVQTGDGVSIAYTEMGTGATTICALHGWGGASSGSWRAMMRRVNLHGLRFVAIDLRGHGQSDPAKSGFDLDTFATDVLAVAERIGAPKFVLLGYSMSGRWSQWIACKFPDRVLGQILIAPAPAGPLLLSDEMLESWMRATGTRESFEGWINQFTSEALPEEIVDEYFADVSRASDLAKRETFKMLRGDDFTRSLESTTAATLVVAGRHDPILSPDFLKEEIVNRIPNARLVQIDCGHEIPFERPAEAAALVEAFVAGLGARR